MEKEENEMSMIPVIDMGECTDCGSCVEVCPEVFRKNPATECMEVLALPEYPKKCVQEGIAVCPADCITWEQT